MHKRLLNFLCLLLLNCLLACQTAVPLPTSAPTPIALETPLSATAESTPIPTSTLVSSPTLIPTLPTATAAPTLPSPTAPPRLNLTIAAPPTLAEILNSILTNFQADWDWQFITLDDPEQALADGRAQFALAEGSNGILIHQEAIILAVPFTTDWETVSLEEAQAILASGDERVTITTWNSLIPSQKALRVNGRHPTEPDYPLQQRWSLLTAEGYQTAANTLATRLFAAWPQTSVIHLVAVGDVMLDRSLGFALQRDELEYPFNGVAEQLRSADITVGNVESSLGNIGQPATKSYTFRAPPQAAPSLALAGFDVVSLANNHGMDYGPETLIQGIQLLREAKVEPVGAGANLQEARTAAIREVNGLKLAFLGYVNVPVEGRGFDTETWTATSDSPGLAWAKPEWITEDVTTVRSQADLVVVILHSGYEYIENPSPPQTAAAQAAIEAGADLVLGHHAHILQGIQFSEEDGVIVYGLGNFAFEIDGPPETMILNAWLDASGVKQLEIVPVIIRFGGQPRLAEPWEAYPIRQNIYRLTNQLNPSP